MQVVYICAAIYKISVGVSTSHGPYATAELLVFGVLTLLAERRTGRASGGR